MKKMVLLLTMLLCMVVISAKEYTFYVGNALSIALDEGKDAIMLHPCGTDRLAFGHYENEASCYITGVYSFNNGNPLGNKWMLEVTYPQASSSDESATYPVVYKYIVSNGDSLTFSAFSGFLGVDITFKVKRVYFNVIVLSDEGHGEHEYYTDK